VRRYGGEVVAGTVTELLVDPVAQAQDRVGYVVRTADGAQVGARRVVVATGLVDVLPDVPGIAERWGRDVLHCPYCHGYEVRDRAVGVLGTGSLAVHQAQLFRQWSADVTLFLHTAPAPDPQEREGLEARGIALVDEEVVGLEVVDDRLRGVRLTSGTVVARDVLVTGAPMRARGDLLASLGVPAVELEFRGAVVGEEVSAGTTGETSLRGVYVAGNVADVRAQVVHAAAAGVLVGANLNADLVGEDTAVAVAARRLAAV
jgi:thioredoxin reductase